LARSRFLDLLQAYPFWVFDASGFAGNPLFTILDPVLGFSAVTSPEVTVEHKEIQPGNWEYKRRVVKSANVSPITMSRGARFYDSDFFVWITNAIKGLQPLRRNLILIHFMGFRPLAMTGKKDKTRYVTELGIASLVERLPGRAWFLRGCLPASYKAGSDFDAKSSEVAIQTLEVQPEYIEELTIGTLSPFTARAFSMSVGVGTAIARAVNR
jgi:phage tail-like protein